MLAGYLYVLHRYTIIVLGVKASFEEIAEAMTLKLRIGTETRADLSVSRCQLNIWLIANGGTETSPKEKPLDTHEHCRARLIWVRDHFVKITSKYMYVCYLNEKFFYATSRRKKSSD